MSTTGSPAPTDGVLAYFPSLAALKAAHVGLLERRRLNGDTPELLAEIVAFIRRGSATGALLNADNERWASQSVLDYWANLLYRAGQEPPDATLAEFDPALFPTLSDALCPYLGLDAFRESHHNLFFGRQRLIEDLLKRLQHNRLLAVVGPSGSGKSSLVLAGLVPALIAGELPGSQNWRYYPPMVPGSDPLMSLARLTQPAGSNPAEWTRLQVERFQQDAGHLAQLIGESGDMPAVLVIDQFEEVFTLCEDGRVRQAFIENLLGLVEEPGATHTVILTMRSDFETFVARLPALQSRFEQAQVRVTPLNAGELRETIEKPAELVGLKFEAGVVDALIQDILGEPAALPLLQFTLLKLWEHREHNWVTWEAYRHLGGGRLALARSADAFYEGLIPEEQVTARRILLRMVRPGEGLEVTSNRIRREALYRVGEAHDRIDRVLDKLIHAWLVRLTEGDTPADTPVEVAHEALVRNWPRLVDWLEDERAAMTMRRRLEAKAAEWARLGQGSSGLLDEVQLREAERWLASPDAAYLGYDETLPALVQASRAAIEEAERAEAARQIELARAQALAEAARQRAEEQARATRRTRQFAAVLLVLLVLAVIATVFALNQQRIANYQRRIADEQRRISDAQRLAFAAQSQLHAAETALLLAYEAVVRDHNPVTEQALRDALDNVLWEPTTLNGHNDRVIRAAFSRDGRRVLTASWDKTARLRDLSGRSLATFRGHGDRVRSAEFSEDGRRVLTASDDTTARLWDLSGKQLITFPHADEVESAEFSPDGQHVLTASADRTAQLWDLSGKQLITFQSHGDQVKSAVFSPDGQRILTASWDKTARLWDLSGQQLVPFQGHGDRVINAEFSPDGQHVLTASADTTARLWNLSGQQLAIFRGHDDFVASAVFSPDGQRILTASHDGTARQYLVNMNDLLAVAACRVGRGLTDEEIDRFEVGTPRFVFTERRCPPVLP